MSRYDQEEGVAYGVCVTCYVELATKEDASRHMEETMTADGDGNRSSHTTRATNPTREQRIRSMVDNAVQDAIQEALENLEEEIDRGRVTREEVAAELIQYPDFSDEWERS